MFKSETEVTWKNLEIGAIVAEPGSAGQYYTGGWRSRRPIVDNNKCNRCGLCYIFCPDACIGPGRESDYEVELFYCKGCGICAEECPRKAINMVTEEG